MATVSVKTNPVIWFEIPVLDIERARNFYESVFALKLSVTEMHQDWGTLTMAMFPENQDNLPGATGTLIKGSSYAPSHTGTLVYFTVGDIEETLRRVLASGGTTIMSKSSIGEYGYIAHFEDTEGNRLALHSMS